MKQPNANVSAQRDQALQRLTTRQLSRTQPEIRKLMADMVEDLSGLLDAMFADVDDYFFSRAESASDSDKHGSYFDSMRMVRLHRQSIKADFFREFVDAAGRFWNGAPKGSELGGNSQPQRETGQSLSVVTDDEFELSVAISGLTEKCNARYGRIFRTLESTLDRLTGRTSKSRGRHPLGIASIADAFVNAAGGLTLELPAMISLLKLFERRVVDNMGRVYGSALRRLADAGISIAEDSETAPSAETLRPVAAQGSQNGTVAFSELQTYLRHGRQEVGGGYESGHPVNVDHLLDTVSSVQHQYLERLPVFEGVGRRPPNLQAFLLNSPVAAGGFRDAGRDQRDMLKLVSDLFEFIFRNTNLSVASKALIARMQIPVLKVALIDESLFSDASHPARCLVNRLAEDGIGWPASEALLKRNALYLAGEKMVAQLNECSRPSIELFSELLAEWSDLVASHQRRTETTVRRLNETVRGKAKLEAAKRIVQTTVNQLGSEVQLPRVVTEFITDFWTPAMVVACVKHGTGGDPWRRICHVLDELLTAFDQLPEEDGVLDTERLVSDLRESLQAYGTDRSVASDALDPIAEALRRVSDPTLAGYEVEDLEVLEEIVLTDVVDAEIEQTSDDYRLVHLEPGSWVEFRDTESTERCKLAMIDENQLYIFTDDSGRKTREASRGKVLEGLASGSMKIVREKALVENAIEELLANLKNYTPKKGG